jgi:hypothetical protein
MNMDPDKRAEVVLVTGGECSPSHLGYLTAGKKAPDTFRKLCKREISLPLTWN